MNKPTHPVLFQVGHNLGRTWPNKAFCRPGPRIWSPLDCKLSVLRCLAHALASDALTDLARPAEVDHSRYYEHPHTSAHPNTCKDDASGNKIQAFVFHSSSTRP